MILSDNIMITLKIVEAEGCLQRILFREPPLGCEGGKEFAFSYRLPSAAVIKVRRISRVKASESRFFVGMTGGTVEFYASSCFCRMKLFVFSEELKLNNIMGVGRACP